jgi:hypothetical protein
MEKPVAPQLVTPSVLTLFIYYSGVNALLLIMPAIRQITEWKYRHISRVKTDIPAALHTGIVFKKKFCSTGASIPFHISLLLKNHASSI